MGQQIEGKPGGLPGGLILTSSGRVLGSQERYSKFQLTHTVGNGNPRRMFETDCPNVRQISQESSAKLFLQILSNHTIGPTIPYSSYD